MAEDVCARCGGRGWFWTDEGEQTCRCRRIERTRLFLRRHGLAGVAAVYPGPLTGGAATPYKGNAIITAAWDTMRAHFAGWLGLSFLLDPNLRVATFTDSELRNLYLGHRPDGEDAEAASCLDRIRGGDLVIVRLRPIKHAATPKALIETIDGCKSSNAHVWIVETPSLPLAKGHPAWTPELAMVLEEMKPGRFRLQCTERPEDDEHVDIDEDMEVGP